MNMVYKGYRNGFELITVSAFVAIRLKNIAKVFGAAIQPRTPLLCFVKNL